MNIFVICQYYKPEIGAPQARLSEMAKEWVREGHQVTVLTGFPNHPTGIIPSEYRGKIFLREELDGVKVWRHWLYATPNKGFLKKILGHLSFMVTVVLLSLFRGARPDKIIVSSPTFFSVFSALLFSLARRAPFAFEVRDLWPGIFVELGVLKNKIVIGILEGLEIFLYRCARKIVVVTKGFKKDIASRGIPEAKIHVITNGVFLDTIDLSSPVESHEPTLRKELGYKEDDFIVLYIGAHGISQGLSFVLDTAKTLMEKNRIKFLFVGEGAEKEELMEKAKREGISNIQFHSAVDRSKVNSFYRLSNVCIVPLRNIEGFKTFIPSKLFEILGNRRPIIASLKGEAADILRESGGAKVIGPENGEALRSSIMELEADRDKAHQWGVVGRKFVEDHYDRSELARQYLQILKDM